MKDPISKWTVRNPSSNLDPNIRHVCEMKLTHIMRAKCAVDRLEKLCSLGGD